MSESVVSIYVIMNPLVGSVATITTSEETRQFYENLDKSGGSSAYDVYEFPAVVVHRSNRRPLPRV